MGQVQIATSMSLLEFQLELNRVAVDMMVRGVRIDKERLASLEIAVLDARRERQAVVEGLLGKPFDRFNDDGEPTFFRSGPQIKALMDQLGQRPGTNRKTGRDSYDDEVLFKIAQRTPGLKTLCYAIIEYRSLSTMLSNFVRARLDPDGRMRCSFNTAGPETFRWASSKNAFWRGTNLQNIGKPFHALTGTALPELRSAIVPDPGYILWEPDLAGADAQVVAFDADDPLLKQMFREGVKIHAERAKWIYGGNAGPDGKKEPYYTLAKKGGHLWHYGGRAKTMSASLGISVAEAETLISRLETMHPAIKAWHRKVDNDVRTKRMIENAFGYRIVVFGRPEEALPQMLAWIGQGTVACIMNRVTVNLAHNVPDAIQLINVHDSDLGETLIEKWDETRPLIREQFLSVQVPYSPEPLVIPPELKVSTESWGKMEKAKW